LPWAISASSPSKNSVRSVQPSTRMCFVHTIFPYVSTMRSRKILTRSTINPRSTRLNKNPTTENATATTLTATYSSATMPVCVPGSKKTPQENQRAWITLVL